MLKPILSLSYSLDQNAQNIFASWLKADFWQETWYGKSQKFWLPAISSKVQGIVKLQPLLPQYSISLTNFQKEKSLEFTLNSSFHTLVLTYSLTGNQPTILNVTIAKPDLDTGFHTLLDWLAKPYLCRHIEKLVATCREIEIPKKSFELETNEQNTPTEQILPTLGFFLWHLVNTWQQQIDLVLKTFNLTSTQWLLLFNLVKLNEKKQETTISSLAEQLGLNQVHVSDVTSSLVKKHYVHKIKLANDKRAFRLTATADGKIAAIQANTSLIQAEKKFFYSISNNQRQQLAGFITQLATPLSP